MSMNCNNCDDPQYDKCVFYTGPDIPALCVKNGDSYADITKSVTDSLILLATGEGTTISDIVVNDPFLKDLLWNQEYTINNLVQALIDYSENIDGRLTTIENVVNAPLSINAPCLTLPANPSKDAILKATAEKLCVVNEAVEDIAADYVKGTDLCTLVAECIDNRATEDGGNSTTIIQQYNYMPKYCVVAYFGPLNVFDATGKGIPALGYDKVYICNGNNGTQDLRGYTLVGANINVSGPALAAQVDPVNIANAGYAISQGTKKGAYTHSLIPDEGPSHTHGVTDGGHEHLLARPTGSFGALTSGVAIAAEAGLGSNSSYALRGVDGVPSVGKSSRVNSNITINSSGLGKAHNNMQPSFGVVWVIFLP